MCMCAFCDSKNCSSKIDFNTFQRWVTLEPVFKFVACFSVAIHKSDLDGYFMLANIHNLNYIGFNLTCISKKIVVVWKGCGGCSACMYFQLL